MDRPVRGIDVDLLDGDGHFCGHRVRGNCRADQHRRPTRTAAPESAASVVSVPFDEDSITVVMENEYGSVGWY